MDTRSPHEIKPLEEVKKLPKQEQRRFIPLTDEEARMLEGKSEEERAAWIDSLPFRHYYDRLCKYEDTLDTKE